ncbi:MAG: hypothetical protein ABFE07_29245 [Armatimonadia bacterium]
METFETTLIKVRAAKECRDAYRALKAAKKAFTKARRQFLNNTRPGEKVGGVLHVLAHLLVPREHAIRQAGLWDQVTDCVVDVSKLRAKMRLMKPEAARMLARVKRVHAVKVGK